MRKHIPAIPLALFVLGLVLLGCEDDSGLPSTVTKDGSRKGYLARENSPGITLITDQPDYAAGEMAVITGGGFLAGEDINIQVSHADGTPNNGEHHDPWTVTADDNGGFETTWNVCTDDCIGSLFLATAEGKSSGLYGEVTFTDADVLGLARVFSVVGTNGACVRQVSTPATAVEKWDVQQGEAYVVTLTNVTDAGNGGTDGTIEVIVKSGDNGNQCLTATQISPQTYTFTVTMPSNACNTFPILYGTSGCSPSTGQLARRSDGLAKQSHLRAANFDENCIFVSEDTDCSGGCDPLTISCPEDFSVCGTYAECGGFVTYEPPQVTGGCGPTTVVCDPPSGSLFPMGTTTVTCSVTDGQTTVTCTFDVTVTGSSVTAVKFYDTNVNGTMDPGETKIDGWKISLVGGRNDCSTSLTQFTAGGVGTSFGDIPLGIYTVSELFPAGSYLATTPTSVLVDLTDCTPTEVRFGNVCLGGGGGFTLGFWSNRNGQNQLNDNGGMGSEFALLSGLCLRNANGTDYNPSAYSNFRNWLLSATATNMAYMLSAQLAAMELNVEAGFVSGSALVYAPGCGDTGMGNNFISIANLMIAANTALCADGYTPDGDPNRAYQECLKNALDNANNNRNFVQSSPCSFPTPY